jgi:hypothetical protein
MEFLTIVKVKEDSKIKINEINKVNKQKEKKKKGR